MVIIYAKIKKIHVIAHLTVENHNLKMKIAATAPITTVMSLLTVTTRTVRAYVARLQIVQMDFVMLMKHAVPVKMIVVLARRFTSSC